MGEREEINRDDCSEAANPQPPTQRNPTQPNPNPTTPHHKPAPVTAFHTCPNLGVIATSLLHHGPSALITICALQPGIPVQPMLANPSTGVGAALLKVGGGVDVLAEWKYDGRRAQMHLISETEVRARLVGWLVGFCGWEWCWCWGEAWGLRDCFVL